MATVIVNTPQSIKVAVNSQSGATVQSLGYGVNTLKALKDFTFSPSAETGTVITYDANTSTFALASTGVSDVLDGGSF